MKTQSPTAARKMAFQAASDRFGLEPLLFQIVQKSVLLLLALCILFALSRAVFPDAVFP
jgi:hypothetical protein